MKRHCGYLPASIALVLVAVLAACSNSASRTGPAAPVPATALAGLLLSADEVNAVMGTNGMVANEPYINLGQHSNLLPNKNCLGIWQVGEAAIYKDSNPTGFRGQDFQQPSQGAWDSLVVQGVSTFADSVASKAFFSESADRWSKCTNHRVNITLNDQALPKLWFGNLTKTDTELSIPVVEGEGASERSCERVLLVDNNVIIDVAACGRSATDRGAAIAHKIREGVGS